jgi:2-methylcitrate dehydratase
VERIDIETFDVAFNIIGGGEEGDKRNSIATKEQADHHSLPYVIAVAILDGDVMPAQYELHRIRREDVQNLLRRVFKIANAAYSKRFPEEIPCRIQSALRNGQTFVKESRDYPGFVSQPVSWEMVCNKFNLLTAYYATEAERKALINAVVDLENTRIQELMQLLAGIRLSATSTRNHNRTWLLPL